jgi:predicted SnoaL-like aldol condensation-catalyzing enzyme
MEQKSNKTIVRECYRKIIRDLDLALVNTYIREDYIQHSPTVKDGRAGLLEMLHFLKSLPKPKGEIPSPIIRVIADGDLVALHLDVKFMGKRMAVVDLFRLQNGQIAEHWDASQVQPDQQDGPVTMTNGITMIYETADTNKTKQLIEDFYRVVPERNNLSMTNEYFNPDYVEHDITNGLRGIINSNIKAHRIITEGNFAVSQCEYNKHDSVFAHYSIFRVEEDKIVEHWSVEQEVPAVMAHSNGMF